MGNGEWGMGHRPSGHRAWSMCGCEIRLASFYCQFPMPNDGRCYNVRDLTSGFATTNRPYRQPRCLDSPQRTAKPMPNAQLPITNYQLPITNYQLPITNALLPSL
ncbi:MAG: hypothetical protein KME31_12995 [Tolypothrix carrinoi HA7290-LM1]|nr:hypothetical protein [Tolypothrix carrinoi HA7290-LM1]